MPATGNEKGLPEPAETMVNRLTGYFKMNADYQLKPPAMAEIFQSKLYGVSKLKHYIEHADYTVQKTALYDYE